MLKRLLIWVVANIDVALALALSIVVGILGLAGAVSPTWVSNAAVLTLSVLAVVLLQDRIRSESAERGVRDEVAKANRMLADLPATLAAESAVRIVTGSEVGHILEAARGETDRWIFRGSTGTFVRIVTIPECVDNARKNRRSLLIRLEILDPTDLELCERYTRLYQALAEHASAPESTWTTDGTRLELFATILAASWYQARFQLVDIDIALSATVSTFRWELSSSSLVITQRGPRFPALVVRSGQLYYDCWSTELRTSFQQARRVPMERARDTSLSVEPTVAEARALFSSLAVELPSEYTDEEVAEIIRKALHDENRPDDPRGIRN